MTEQASTLRRKLGSAPQPAGEQSVATRALRIALARAADRAANLPLEVRTLDSQRRGLGEVLDNLPERAMNIVLEGPGEALGLLALSPGLTSALIEQQTMGRVSRTEPEPRRPTRTDAALVADFVESLCREFETALDGDPALGWAGGFHYASFLDDPRPLGLLLDDALYRLFPVNVELGNGARQATLILALPAEGRGHFATAVGAEPPDAGAARSWQEDMRDAVLASEARLDAVLARMTIPLDAVLGLKPGDMVPVATSALDRIVLETGGRHLAEGRLGQHKGNRALRLTRAPEPPVAVIRRDAEG
ncbi:MAG: FliM/FliN family flagellar motor switch protein [Paracoccaceae bacterium]